MSAPEPGGRSAWPVVRLVLAALLVVLVAAGVYARAHTSVPFRSPPRLSPTTVTTTFLAVEAIGLVLVVLLAVTRRRRRKRDGGDSRSPTNRWIVVAVNLTAFVLALLLASWLIRHFRDANRPRLLPSLGPSAGSTHRPDVGLPPGAGTLWLIWLGVVVLAVAGVVAVALWQRRRARPPSPPDEPVPAPDARDTALRAGRRALDASADPRGAVIACYEAMERNLAEAGVERSPAQTPEELLSRARGRDVVTSDRAARTLVELFGRARFSSRPVDAPDVATARNALAELLAAPRDRARP
ncbi:MAG: DUF4129 domain-containing protein [Streptosporangiales bacterium]|nr:DUF4129 domain-containing protein [Streptosporangiales bacterium]MBO0891579.1 DUF4129 domain-containing protein [Acidothermales bacterium]